MSFYYSNDNGEKAITVFGSLGRVIVADGNNPNFDDIYAAAEEGDFDEAVELYDLSKAIGRRFEKLTERISVSDGTVYFDGDPINNALTVQILRFLKEDLEFKPLVNFMERIMLNPNEHSREQLWRWLDAHEFAITPEGYFVGYKGVARDGSGKFVSINSGKAIVDGVAKSGKIPQAIGSTIEMPRSEVQHDPSVGCHKGLHVGTWAYASTFGNGAVLEVIVDPRDVVSVPTDCGDAKLRCCRYMVIKVLDAPLTSAFRDYDDDYYYDDEEPCDYYRDYCDCDEGIGF